MLQPLEWDEDEALTKKRVPEPVAETLRGFRPRITILGMPAAVQPLQELDWDEHEGITQKCTPFHDEPEELPSWEDEKTLPDLSALRGDEPQVAVKEVEVDARELYTPAYPTYPVYPPPVPQPAQQPSVPPMAVDTPARSSESGWSKFAAVTSTLVLAAMAAFVAWFFMPRTGTLRIELEHEGAVPSRAEIYVDGQKRCDTDPCLVADLQPGARSIKVLVEGADVPVESEGDVAAGETRVITVKVALAQGIRARSRHKGVRVWVDGDERGKLPVELGDLAAGTHQLRFAAGESFGELTRTVEVPAGRIVDLGDIDLEVRKVDLKIELGTADARVQLIDPEGKVSAVSGPFPATVVLSPGRYRIVGSKPGFAPLAETLVLGKEPTHTVRLVLSPRRSHRDALEALLEQMLRGAPRAPDPPPSAEVPEQAEEPPPTEDIEGASET